MDIERLKEFIEIADSGSLKKAAETLHVSAATLSARLKNFELSLGLSLFNRSHAVITVTEEGSRFLANARSIIEDYTKLTGELAAVGHTQYRDLKIAVSGTGLPLYLGPFLDILNRRYPTIHLELLDDTICSIQNGLLSETVDVYFSPALSSFSANGITKITVSASSHQILVPIGHPLADRTLVSMEDLAGECFIPYPETASCCIRDFQLANLAASGIRFSLYTNHTSPAFYKLLVPIGKGIILLPTSVMDLPPNTQSITVSNVIHPAPFCLFYNKNSPKPEIHTFVAEFCQFIQEAKKHDHRKTL